MILKFLIICPSSLGAKRAVTCQSRIVNEASKHKLEGSYYFCVRDLFDENLVVDKASEHLLLLIRSTRAKAKHVWREFSREWSFEIVFWLFYYHLGISLLVISILVILLLFGYFESETLMEIKS